MPVSSMRDSINPRRIKDLRCEVRKKQIKKFSTYIRVCGLGVT